MSRHFCGDLCLNKYAKGLLGKIGNFEYQPKTKEEEDTTKAKTPKQPKRR